MGGKKVRNLLEGLKEKGGKKTINLLGTSGGLLASGFRGMHAKHTSSFPFSILLFGRRFPLGGYEWGKYIVSIHKVGVTSNLLVLVINGLYLEACEQHSPTAAVRRVGSSCRQFLSLQAVPVGHDGLDQG